MTVSFRRFPSPAASPHSPLLHLVMLIAAMMLSAALLSGCRADAEPAPETSSSESSESSEKRAAAPVYTTTARAAETPLPIRTSGRLATRSEIPLAFKVGGVVAQVLVDEGETVRRGQTLARLQTTEIDAQVTEAKSAVEKARRDLQRTETLQRDSVATLEELQNARTAVEVAEARLQAARFNRRHAVISAPGGGRVLRQMVEAGQTVSGGQPILVVGAATSGFVLRVGLADRDVVRIAPGDSASVVLHALPSTPIPARVVEVAGAASPQTGTYAVELQLAPDDEEVRREQLRSGFTGTAELFPRANAEHVRLPAEALVEGDGRTGVVFVFDADGHDSTGVARRQTVEVDGFWENDMAVRGTEPGTPIIVRGATDLRDQDPVRLVARP